MERGKHEPDEVSRVRRCLGQCDVFVNVGASYGYYCCLARHAGKQVVAFEPGQSCLRVLHRNLWANAWQDVEVHPVAVGERTGFVDFFGSGTSASLVRGWAGATGLSRRRVPLTTLDAALGDRLSGRRCIFLIDIEGGELGCLRGARRQLALQPAPIWIVEIVATEHQPRGVLVNPNLRATFDLLWAADYDAWTVEASPRLVGPEEIDELASGRRADSECQNFLFLRQDVAADRRAVLVAPTV
jgi:FkbM family methyltransferase